MNIAELVAQTHQYSTLLDKGITSLRENAVQLADAEHSYRLAVAKAWMASGDGTVQARKAQVDADTADLRRVRDIAEGMRVASLEAVRSRRAQLSALQSVAASMRADLEMHTYNQTGQP
jgi:hypothetical protein